MLKLRYIILLFMALACSGRQNEIDDVMHGTISYPFLRTEPVGLNGQREKLVIKSIKGNSQYVIEFPNEGTNYDIEIPMASKMDDNGQATDQPQDLPSPVATDMELTRNLPDVAKSAPNESKLIDKAFGVSSTGKPSSAPSYAMGLAKVNNLFKTKKFEYALIELNNLLAFYPNSPRFWKMKGTIYLRIHNYKLAEKSWLRALELEPYDKALQKSLASLQEKIKDNQENPAPPQ